MSATVDIVVNGLQVPRRLIADELDGLYGSRILTEFQEIIRYYQIYEKGADFTPETLHGDFIGADLHFKESRKLINKEARFLFSKRPDIWIDVPYDKTADDEKEKALAKEQATQLQTYLDAVFEKTGFFSKLVKAAKDCFIGKRVAYFVNFDEKEQRVMIDFIPSLEFIFDTDVEDINHLTKIIAFYTVKDSQNRSEQLIYKKKYWLQGADKTCWISEALYNGLGDMVEELTPERPTKFKGVIPAGVIINDGLTGDVEGVSEINDLEETESWFSRISNADIDSERCGMNPIRWARDMSPASTKNLSIAPGAFWDLATDQNTVSETAGEVGMMEPSLNYATAVNSTLSRIRSSMFETLDIPDVSADALKGVVSSGKTLKAIYWSLIVRCDEKMLAWRPAIKHIVELLIAGAKLYPKSVQPYTQTPLPDTAYTVTVDNQYPLPDDETDEKQIDLAEVNAQTMSKMAYMKKWRGLTDAEAMQELKQIALERELLEDSYGNSLSNTAKKEDMGEDTADEDNREDDNIENKEQEGGERG